MASKAGTHKHIKDDLLKLGSYVATPWLQANSCLVLKHLNTQLLYTYTYVSYDCV